ncbi:MAG: hypothetical protein AAGB46_13270 [Verrucomicrobiota bacterium]
MKLRPRQPILILISALAALFLYGCKTTYNMEVDANRNPNITATDGGESYIIVPRDPNMDTESYEYQQTEAWIKNALAGKGLYEALTPEDADMVIEIDYGMEPPRMEHKIVEEPVWVVVQSPPRTVATQVVDPNTGKVTTVYTRVPGERRKELSHYEERVITRIVNEKYMEIAAKENTLEETGDRPSQELWSVQVRNDDSNNDLGEYLPILAAATADYIGEETPETEKLKIKEDDEVVDFVKTGGI